MNSLKMFDHKITSFTLLNVIRKKQVTHQSSTFGDLSGDAVPSIPEFQIEAHILVWRTSKLSSEKKT
jgi:hypothetical protein